MTSYKAEITFKGLTRCIWGDDKALLERQAEELGPKLKEEYNRFEAIGLENGLTSEDLSAWILAMAQAIPWETPHQEWKTFVDNILNLGVDIRETPLWLQAARYGDRATAQRLAANRTAVAQAAIEELRRVLVTGVGHATVDWDGFKDRDEFSEGQPRLPPVSELPREPLESDPEFALCLSAVKRLFGFGATRLAEDNAERLRKAKAEWQERARQIGRARQLAHEHHSARTAAWQERRSKFFEAQKKQHREIDAWREACARGDAGAIERWVTLVLSRSQYPVCCRRKEFNFSFSAANGGSIVDYRLPTPSDIPTLKGVRYVATRSLFEGVQLRPNEAASLYDQLIYQICLRTLHEIFRSDLYNKIDGIVFNGWVDCPDPATGKIAHSCIVSVQAQREVFLEMNLERVDPRACFRALKGVGSAKLHGMVPIAPILRGNREDPRFVESIEVADRIREGTNLAAIGWEDFEHLIREIFEKEFSAAGGEVRVTRASRDWGVDAIVFDPDPIRGGKIVIQAKRYTNTVEVSAVRDLYGTVVNEGATKGILVTTSAFRPESYAFAKDKPLTLLDGSNLLHLLERHGHRAHNRSRGGEEAKRGAARSVGCELTGWRVHNERRIWPKQLHLNSLVGSSNARSPSWRRSATSRPRRAAT